MMSTGILCGFGTLVTIVVMATHVAAATGGTTVVRAGNFEVMLTSGRISSGRFPNISAVDATMPVSSFTLRHGGQVLKVQDFDRDRNKPVSFDEFWDARVLDGTPRPAVLLARTGVYLYTERGGQPVLEILVSENSDIASLQWIDGPDGRPGAVGSITLRDSSRESRQLAGGRYLLVNGSKVLDIKTLKVTAVPRTSETIDGALAGYNSSDWSPRWLSPGRTQYAFIGTRSRVANYQVVDIEYAVIVVEFTAGRAYAVPFDRNATRYHVAEYAPASWHDEWFSHYLAWVKDARGSERLELRGDVEPLPTIGVLNRAIEGSYKGLVTGYKIELASPQLLNVLEAFIVREFGGKPVAAPERSLGVRLEVDGATLELSHSVEFRTLQLADSYFVKQGKAHTFRVLERIAEGFNAELAKGLHQQHFLRIEGLR